MKKVTIKKIELTNFKGIAHLTRQFDGAREVIKAPTGAGKSTIMYAWLWAQGIDVPDVIPTFDNREVHNLETSVEVTLDVDGLEYVLKRVQTEQWSTNKDTGIEEKDTNTSVYSIDGVEFAAKKYVARLAEIFGVAADKIEMLSNKDYFNSDKPPKWTWKERRRELFSLSGADEIVKGLADKSEYELIATDIKKGTTTTDLRRAKMKSLRGCSDEKERNLTLLNDKLNDIQLYGSYNFAELEVLKTEYEKQINALTVQEIKQDYGAEKQRLSTEIDNCIKERIQLELADTNERTRLANLIRTAELDMQKITSAAEQLKSSATRRDTLLSNLKSLDNKQWKGNEVCPTCKQALPLKDVESAKLTFAEDIQRMKEITLSELAPLEKYLADYDTQLTALRKKYQQSQIEKGLIVAEHDNFEPNPKIAVLSKHEQTLRQQLTNLQTEGTVNVAQEQLAELKERLKKVQHDLAYKQIVADYKLKAEELQKKNRELTDTELVLKTSISQIDAYVAEQVSLITNAINARFGGGVSFSLFSELYAGAESDYKETCTCMLDGKVYSSMSTGEKFIANLEVVAALQSAYDVALPIFCDNAECYTKDFDAAGSQIIELRATKDAALENCLKFQNIKEGE